MCLKAGKAACGTIFYPTRPLAFLTKRVPSAQRVRLSVFKEEGGGESEHRVHGPSMTTLRNVTGRS